MLVVFHLTEFVAFYHVAVHFDLIVLLLRQSFPRRLHAIVLWIR